jgi:hypothetical protein
VEGLGVREGFLVFKLFKAGNGAYGPHQRIDARAAARDGAVDAFFRDQQCAADAVHAADVFKPCLQFSKPAKGREAVQRRDDVFFCHNLVHGSLFNTESL